MEIALPPFSTKMTSYWLLPLSKITQLWYAVCTTSVPCHGATFLRRRHFRVRVLLIRRNIDCLAMVLTSPWAYNFNCSPHSSQYFHYMSLSLTRYQLRCYAHNNVEYLPIVSTAFKSSEGNKQLPRSKVYVYSYFISPFFLCDRSNSWHMLVDCFVPWRSAIMKRNECRNSEFGTQ